jgi:hypothetical protein
MQVNTGIFMLILERVFSNLGSTSSNVMTRSASGGTMSALAALTGTALFLSLLDAAVQHDVKRYRG